MTIAAPVAWSFRRMRSMTGEMDLVARLVPGGSNSYSPCETRMNNRSEIHAADLYVLLEKEFKRRKPGECSQCYVQLPYRVDRADGQASNWELVVPTECPYNCRVVIEDLVQEYGARYDLAEDRRG